MPNTQIEQVRLFLQAVVPRNSDQWMSTIRSALKTLGGAATTYGAFSASKWTAISGFLAVVAGFVWSWVFHADVPTPDAPVESPKAPVAPVAMLLLAGSLLIAGCANFDSSAYKGVGATVVTVDSSRAAWNQYVIDGHATTNQVVAAADAYTKYQAAMHTLKAAELSYNIDKDKSKYQQAVDAAIAAASHFEDVVRAFTYQTVYPPPLPK